MSANSVDEQILAAHLHEEKQQARQEEEDEEQQEEQETDEGGGGGRSLREMVNERKRMRAASKAGRGVKGGGRVAGKTSQGIAKAGEGVAKTAQTVAKVGRTIWMAMAALLSSWEIVLGVLIVMVIVIILTYFPKFLLPNAEEKAAGEKAWSETYKLEE